MFIIIIFVAPWEHYKGLKGVKMWRKNKGA